MQLLTETTFKNGLVQGVPDGIPVAHKFGEQTIVNPTDNSIEFRELHDCGIIYYPKSPYFLCVMTKGEDFTKLQSIIAEISSISYQKINSNNP